MRKLCDGLAETFADSVSTENEEALLGLRIPEAPNDVRQHLCQDFLIRLLYLLLLVFMSLVIAHASW